MMKYFLVLLALMLSVHAHAAKKKQVLSPFGMGLHSIQGDVKAHDTAIEQCRDAGIKLIRDDIAWQNIEREKGVLKVPDNIAQNIENTVNAGIEPLIILDYGNPLYDNGNAPVSKEAVEAFARYAEFLTRTFKGKVKYWEVWNEPNIPIFWKPSPYAKDYANLLRATYKACKKGNPDCTVIGVVTSRVDLPFIESVLKEGGAKYMDILSVHLTAISHQPSAISHSEILSLRELMDKNGMKGKPIWITEIGWPTHQGGVTPEVQAQMLPRSYLEALSAGVESTFWYWLGNDGPDKADPEQSFGIRFADGSPKPAYLAYQTMTRSITGATFDRSVWLGENIRAYVFTKDNAEITAMWCPDGVANVTFVGEDEIKVVGGIAGDGITLSPVNTIASLTLTESPCYVTRKGEMNVLNVLPIGAFQFLPPQAVVVAGETQSIGIQVVNAGREPLELKIRILSENMTPAEHTVVLSPESKQLLVSKLTLPASSPDVIRIPAEVEAGGKLAARLEMLLRITRRG